ncbi:hypothetical protein F2P81_019504 [Scophthalmus maximus]|uniref:Uncharacterized protein n=1 Tax=Scophthalmus maximus TaxID=52904 RepID=A0A6A4S5W0_SCOMX|nr:hypothetical protein F2P81_019504 [Scophthalmus maximus]
MKLGTQQRISWMDKSPLAQIEVSGRVQSQRSSRRWLISLETVSFGDGSMRTEEDANTTARFGNRLAAGAASAAVLPDRSVTVSASVNAAARQRDCGCHPRQRRPALSRDPGARLSR